MKECKLIEVMNNAETQIRQSVADSTAIETLHLRVSRSGRNTCCKSREEMKEYRPIGVMNNPETPIRSVSEFGNWIRTPNAKGSGNPRG
jgi:hypothetical protein